MTTLTSLLEDLADADADAAGMAHRASSTHAPSSEPSGSTALDSWRILIVDDETQVHDVTKLALRRYACEGRSLEYLSAFSAAQAREILRTEPGIAVVLLDVIMEADDSGLELVRYIREELGNRRTRIILRTGQPDDLPETSIIMNYDINDYKTKTELTQTKLVTTITSALRSFRDVVELETKHDQLIHLSDRLRYEANHDSLTGLINRREFERRLEDAIAAARNRSGEHALCYIDLDQFRVVNDTFGHVAGDELLRQLAAVLRSTVRAGDTIARLGGDEFALLLPDCPLPQARTIAETALACIKDFRFTWNATTLSVGASIGVVPIDEQVEGVIGVLEAADQLAYLSKDQGGNRVHTYTSDDGEIEQRRCEIKSLHELKDAIELSRLKLYFQPIVSLQGDSRGQRYEVLVRMVDRDGAIVRPDKFLPTAEKYRMTTQLDEWVTTNVIDRLSANPTHMKRLALCSINLSGCSLTDDGFCDQLVSRLDHSAIPASKICFEITETAAITNLNKAVAFIERVRGLGCKFALDDFGTGFCSFAYLRDLPVDFVKVDGTFVQNLLNGPIEQAMVGSINDIVHAMGKQTVAEFVDSAELVTKLTDMGIDYAQGYHIAEPAPLVRI